ncbi:MAG: polysaccharide pyruvyl transferase CsaB [Armatimonadetes bacterium]|nr:polysaccharide pyruvyl transferase CsaB [Armatimonadota bacterium]
MAHSQRPPAGRHRLNPHHPGAPLDRPVAAPIVVSGYYGLGNLGDEAVLAGLLSELRARLPDARIVVLSADPAGTRALHQVEAWPRDPAGVWRTLRGAQLLISGGGSLVQDVTSARSALYYLGAMLAAGARGVPLAVVGQGIGPVRRRWVLGLARRAFGRAAAISVRDGDSARTLVALGIRQPVHRGADLAFLMPPPPPDRVRALLVRWGLEAYGTRIGLAPRPWPGLLNIGAFAEAVRQFADRRRAAVAVFPFDLVRDRAVASALAEATRGRLVEAESPQDLLGLIGAMDMMIGVRLHALVFAAAQGVPAVGLAYDPKVSAFMVETGLPGLLPVEATGTALQDALAATWDARDALRARLLAVLPGFRAAAAAGVATAVAVLEASPHQEAAGVPPQRTE